VEWCLNNRKDPTLRQMIKVITKATNGSELLSFLKDRNWETPGDRRRKPRWDLLRTHQHETHERGLERLEITGQSQGGGEDPLAWEETEYGVDEARTLLTMQADDTSMEGTETNMSVGGEDTTGTETTKTTPPSEEVEGTMSSEEETLVSSSDSEEETTSTGGSEDHVEGEGISGSLSPPPSLTREEQGQPRRRGRTRQRVRGVGRVWETQTLLSSRTYCSHAKIQRDIKSLLHLGPSGRDEELSLTTFEKCADPRVCGTQRGPAGTSDRCPDCIVRQTGSGFSPCSTGKRMRRFKALWLNLRGD
jgi:hypothetical protein